MRLFQNKENTDSLESAPRLGRGFVGGEIVLRSPLKKLSSQRVVADAARVNLLRSYCIDFLSC